MASRLEILVVVAVFIVALAAVSFALFQNPAEKCAFEAVEDGIKFCSSEKEPSALLKGLADSNEFVVAIYQSQGEDLSFAANTMVSFQSLLSANRKSTTLLVLDYSGGGLSKCQTNYGLVQVNKEISAAECGKILDRNESVFIFIENPDNSLEQPEVAVEGLKITLKPRLASDMQGMALVSLKAMFADSEETIKKINEMLKTIKGV